MSSDRTFETCRNASVAVVLVNYCTRDLTLDCLRSLSIEVADHPGAEVLVVDNASPDGSGEEIANAITANGWSRWARVLAMPRNGGFGYGNNGAVRVLLDRTVSPDYIWLLNTDTVVREGALRDLVEFMDAHPEAGAAGSRLEHEDGTRQASAFAFIRSSASSTLP